MNITFDIPEPRFKVGDIIRYKKDCDITAKIIAITRISGTWSCYKGEVHAKQDTGDYVYRCLEFCKDAKGEIIPEGTILVERITDLDKWVF